MACASEEAVLVYFKTNINKGPMTVAGLYSVADRVPPPPSLPVLGHGSLTPNTAEFDSAALKGGRLA